MVIEPASPAQRMLDAIGPATLFHTPDGDAYAGVTAKGVWQVHKVDSTPFRNLLRQQLYESAKTVARKEQLDELVAHLTAEAQFEGAEEDVALRLGTADGAIYIDLGNPQREVAEVTATGWTVLSNEEACCAPVYFRRSKTQGALPTPGRGGNVAMLREHINVRDEHWPLVVGWLLQALNPSGQYPPLILVGEHGSGKSTMAKMLRYLVDPHSPMSRGEPRGDDELMAAVTNNWVLSFDNLSGLSPKLSDALCRISTEGGFASRQLYTNSEEVAIEAKRPIIITSIAQVVSRGDLASRGLVIETQPIAEGYRDEGEAWQAFQRDAQLILGALLDALVTALRRLPETPQTAKWRMAGFIRWVQAAEDSLPWESGHFVACYSRNYEASAETALESNLAAMAVLHLLGEEPYWTGKPADLLATLADRYFGVRPKPPTWPNTANKLEADLKRAAAGLRGHGVSITRLKRSNAGSRWHLDATGDAVPEGERIV